jgi:hypothetical protein
MWVKKPAITVINPAAKATLFRKPENAVTASIPTPRRRITTPKLFMNVFIVSIFNLFRATNKIRINRFEKFFRKKMIRDFIFPFIFANIFNKIACYIYCTRPISG